MASRVLRIRVLVCLLCASFTASGAGARHRGVFFVDGVGDTDGVHYVPIPLGRQFPLGLLVVQNGEAPEPPDTGDVNGCEFDGSTQFMYLNFADTLRTAVSVIGSARQRRFDWTRERCSVVSSASRPLPRAGRRSG
jgi:hypothetical protein